jgi:hypothetical protein
MRTVPVPEVGEYHESQGGALLELADAAGMPLHLEVRTGRHLRVGSRDSEGQRVTLFELDAGRARALGLILQRWADSGALVRFRAAAG